MCGVRENAVRRKLLKESGPTLSKCVDICPAAEATSAQLKEMALSQHSSEVDLVVKAEHKKPNSRKEKMKSPKDQLVEECKLCGRQHERNRAKCPAYGQICSLCGKLNPFAVNVETNPVIPRSLLRNPSIERSISLPTAMTQVTRLRKKFCLCPLKTLSILWKCRIQE